MFDLGKDIRRLFSPSRGGEDLSWVELVPPEMLQAEAVRAATAADRARPNQREAAWFKAAALWREHARRTGQVGGLNKAMQAAASREAVAADAAGRARARLDATRTLMLQFDLCGGAGLPARVRLMIDEAVAALPADDRELALAQARLAARELKIQTSSDAEMDVAARLEQALACAADAMAEDVLEARFDRAVLCLEAGLLQRDAGLLDRAGRDLRALVEAAQPERRPLTRARALMLSGAGLACLAAMARDGAAMKRAVALVEAAGDQFTADHSPLDWAAVELARPEAIGAPLSRLAALEVMAGGQGLVLGALARERRVAREVDLAVVVHDGAALDVIALRLHRRLKLTEGGVSPPDWIADQIGLGHVAAARVALGQPEPAGIRLALTEALQAATEEGLPVLADRARSVLSSLN